MNKYFIFIFLFILFYSADVNAKCRANFYRLSTGGYVDVERASDGVNGAIAEQICQDKGMRLPTLYELREMYKKMVDICRYYNKNPKSCFNTEFDDAGGWPYWSERIPNKKISRASQKAPLLKRRDYGGRIIFGQGSDNYVQVSKDAMVRKFGNEGEEQIVEFWASSGRGAYTRCVCDL